MRPPGSPEELERRRRQAGRAAGRGASPRRGRTDDWRGSTECPPVEGRPSPPGPGGPAGPPRRCCTWRSKQARQGTSHRESMRGPISLSLMVKETEGNPRASEVISGFKIYRYLHCIVLVCFYETCSRL